MKKNSKKADIQKPEIGEYYFANILGEKSNPVMIMSIEGNHAKFKCLETGYTFLSRWNFKKFPKQMEKLTPLEVELL